jgi:hypothetical protein
VTVKTRFDGLSRSKAWGVVAVFVIVGAWLLMGALTRAPASIAQPAAKQGDVAMYKEIVARVRGGEGYYDVVGSELRERHFPVRPSLNWRQPTYAWLLSRLPNPAYGTALIAALGLAVVACAYRWMRAANLGGRAPMATGVFAVNMCGFVVADFIFLQESWAGFFVALSIVLFALDLWPAAVAAALAALAFRELALLPCLVGMVFALRRRRWPEVASWIAGLAVYGALMSLHAAEARARYLPGDLTRDWFALGGAAFIVETAKWSPLFVALPSSAVALLLPFVFLGLAGWRDAGAGRAALVVFGYVIVFAFVGHPFNDYWGSIYAPLLAIGVVGAPASVRDLVRSLRHRP